MKEEKSAARHNELLLVLLGSVVQSSGQVQAATGVILRWGLSAIDAQGTSNRDNLLRELDDLKASIRRLEKVLSPSQLTLGDATNEPGLEPTDIEAQPANGR